MASLFLAFKRFSSSQRGNVAMIFGLCVIPFLVLAGMAIDVGRAILVRERLGQAIDAAILAVGAAPHLDAEESQALGEEFFEANFGNAMGSNAYDIDVTVLGDSVTMSARANVPTTLLALLNHENIGLYQEAEALRGGQDLELVMVLDNTGSMSGSKISALRTAASNAVEIIFAAGGSDPEAVKIGLVPFASTVNIGTAWTTADTWLDWDAESPAHHHSHTWNADINRFDLFEEVGIDWAGCVESRPEPHDMEDTAPSAGDPETLFVPYFFPDVPGNRGSASSGFTDAHSWLADHEYTRAVEEGTILSGLTTLLLGLIGVGLPDALVDELGVGEFYDTRNEARQAYVGKYYYSNPSNGSVGPNRDCIGQAITPITTDEEDLVDEIEDMQAAGNTNIPNGISWGVRVLSPGAPYTQGRAWDTEELVKAMIVLTDGENVMSGQDNINMSTYNTYGFIAEGRFGITTDDGGDLADRLDDKTTEVCDYAKELGVRVYTITFQVSDSNTRELMEDCASLDDDGDALYWNSPSNSELEQTFMEIAKDLVDLRLTR